MSRSRLTGALVAATVLSMLPGYQRVGADQPDANAAPSATALAQAPKPDASKFLTQPLVTDIYTADPSAHVFDGKIFIYPSHDIDAGVPPDDLGSHFAMRDYHVFSMDTVGGPVTDHGVALDIKNVPWAGRQMWAPDAAEKGGKYYLYFPVKDKQDVFRIGAAVADKPWGPFTAQPAADRGELQHRSRDLQGHGGEYYMYFGGIWGGQLQRWATGTYKPADVYPAPDQPALSAKVARLGDDMVSFAEAPKDVVLQDENGKPLTAGDNARRFFEAAWLHKYNGTYYFSYSTGDTHFIIYATGDVAVRSVHHQGKDPGAGARLDESPLDRRVQGEVVSLLPRRAGVGRADAPAQHQGDGAEIPG